MTEENDGSRIIDPDLAHEAGLAAKSSIDSSVGYQRSADEIKQNPDGHLSPDNAIANNEELARGYNDQAERISDAVQRGEKVGEEITSLDHPAERQAGDHESPFSKSVK